ncbi:MAG: type II secretion system protein N [Gammaproteobacteria bacterium]|nr:type II secretion system protein N [Gammaproteobacteria bacterium]
MKSWIYRALAALALLLLFVALRAPAQHAVAYASANIKPAVISGSQGSVWNGNAERITHPQIQLNNVEWDYRFFASLFKGPGYVLNGNTNNGQFSGLAHVGWGQLSSAGNAKLSDVNAIIPLSDLPLPAIARSIPLKGDIIAKLEQFTLAAQWPVEAEGQLAIADIRFDDKEVWQLGALIADLETTETGVKAKLSSASDYVNLSGVANLENDGSYQVTADLTVDNSLPIALRTMLIASGKRQADGSIRISYQGRVPRPQSNEAP